MTSRALVEVAPGRFDDLVAARGGDVYLMSGYVASACHVESGEPVFLHLPGPGGDVVFAAILRFLPGGLADVTTPYGYGGPVAFGKEPPVGAFWLAYEDWCRDRSVVASFFRFHPLYENHRYAGPGVRCERLGPTISWLLAGERKLLDGLHPTHRNKVRKAERAGASVSVTEAPGDLTAFSELYRETMGRLAADAFYRFDGRYWELLVARLGERLLTVDARIGDELAASALCLVGPRWLHYHLSATSELGRRFGAANLVLLAAARWGRAHGLEEFHLGGGLGGREDSLLAFKEHFAPGSRREAFIGKAVHDRESYLALSGSRTLDLDGRFPAYRRAPAGRE